MRKTFLTALILITAGVCPAWQAKFVRDVAMKDERQPLMVASSIVVMDNGDFLFTDIKDRDAQFKAFDGRGRLIKAWGKMGQGPDEFMGLAGLVHREPYLAVQDCGKHVLHVFRNVGNYRFQRLFDVPDRPDGIGKLYGGNVIIYGYIKSPQDKDYCVSMTDFGGRKTDYIIPNDRKYADSPGENRKIWEEVSGLSANGYFDLAGDTLFFVSDVRISIVRLDMKTRRIGFFGKPPGNFHPLSMSRKTHEELLQPETGKEVGERLRTNCSFVSGLFADKDIVGVIYVNRDRKIGGDLFYTPYLQIYDHAGKLLNEQSLTPAYFEDTGIQIHYNQDKRRLYLLRMLTGGEDYEYSVLEYSIEK